MAAKNQNWTQLDPSVPVKVVHQRSRQERIFQVDATWGNKLEGRWGMAGVVVFDLLTGYGAGECREWRLTLESARHFAGEGHQFKEPARTVDGHALVRAKVRQPGPQLDLLGWTPRGPAATPAPAPNNFKAKAHRQIMGGRS